MKARILNEEQNASLARATTLRQERNARRLVIEEELAALRSERLSRLDETIDEEVYRAALLGVPKTRIAKAVYGHNGATEVYRTIERVRARRGLTEDEAGPARFATSVAEDGSIKHHFTYDDETGEVVIDYPAFQTQSSAAEYPDFLRGRVVFDPSEPNNWRVTEDETDDTDARGFLMPGWLRFEVDQVPLNDEQILITDLLSKWWEETEPLRTDS